MARSLRPIGHDERLSVIDHLDELRSRLIVCGFVLVIAFGVCFWQNHALLNVLNRALPHSSTVAAQSDLANLPRQSARERAGIEQQIQAVTALASPASGLSAAARHDYAREAAGLRLQASSLPKATPAQVKPITIGIGEPFTTTLTVVMYFALLFSLPLIIYQGYAFVIPALNPNEKRVAIPIMAVAPLLFALGVAFAYVIVLPPAVRFLQGYNSSKFDILVQAKAYYTFEILTMLGIGLAFQLPLGLLALDRIGTINARTLIRQWRYATVIIAVIAAALPGADPVTTALEMLPLILLYLASIALLTFADRRAAKRAAAEAVTAGGGIDGAL
jgi:sec-independent protein translocase protein TatC